MHYGNPADLEHLRDGLVRAGWVEQDGATA
jgi:hypothetical protein